MSTDRYDEVEFQKLPLSLLTDGEPGKPQIARRIRACNVAKTLIQPEVKRIRLRCNICGRRTRKRYASNRKLMACGRCIDKGKVACLVDEMGKPCGKPSVFVSEQQALCRGHFALK